jgi:hypothetical protein
MDPQLRGPSGSFVSTQHVSSPTYMRIAGSTQQFMMPLLYSCPRSGSQIVRLSEFTSICSHKASDFLIRPNYPVTELETIAESWNRVGGCK